MSTSTAKITRMLTDKVEVATERVISGKGLIASQPIRRGEVVWQPDEGAARRTGAELQLLPPDNTHCQIGVDLFVYVEPAAWCYNHSCDPNTFLEDGRQVAARDIHAGEEVTYDYGIHEIRWSWGFDCSCGSASCRRQVSSRDYLDRRLMARAGVHAPHHARVAAEAAGAAVRVAYRTRRLRRAAGRWLRLMLPAPLRRLLRS